MAVTIDRSDWEGRLWPPQVTALALDALIAGAPFSRALTRMSSSASATVFPLADITGGAWVPEGQPLPDLSKSDRAYVVASAKLAGILTIGNESINDTSIDLTAQVSRLLVDAFSGELDEGLLTGGGPPAPNGVIPLAPAVSGTSLWAAVAEAIGEINNAGGVADTVAISATAAAAEAGRLDLQDRPLFPEGMTTYQGLKVVSVPGASLTSPLVFDSTRMYFIVRTDFTVEMSAETDTAWRNDALSLRIKGRFAVATPTPTKSVRKLTGVVGMMVQQQSGGGDDDLESKTVPELQAEAQSKGLPVGGTKAEIIARLRES